MMIKPLLSAAALALSVATASVAQTDNADTDQVLDQIKAEFDRAEALRRGDGVPVDLEASFKIFEGLAAQDHARSMDRVGLATWRGAGTAQDLARAEDMFRKAIAGGHTKSRINLGRLLGEVGRGPEALEVLQRAADENLKDADLWIAKGHVNGVFGTSSEPAQGKETLDRLAAGGNKAAAFALADALRGQAALEADLPRSLELFETLAEEGDANALYRVGTAYMRGRGTEPDLERAIAAYRASADAGRAGALVNLGRALSRAGRGAEARRTLEQAVAAGVKNAEFWLARGHFERGFGRESDVALGADKLFDLASSGSEDAAALVVKSSRKRVFRKRDFSQILNVLDEGAKRNDARAIEALLTYHRLRHRGARDTVPVRRELLETKGEHLSPRALLSEKIELASDAGPGEDGWKEIDALLSSAEGPLYERGLLAAYKADRRAYTYHLQRELAERGYYSGRISGWMNRGTILAFRAFCRSEAIDDVCTHGPLRVDAVRALAEVWG